jgi:hypothetical protein
LDGEMLVWDTVLNRFAEFGSNQEIAKAAKEGLETDRQVFVMNFYLLHALFFSFRVIPVQNLLLTDFFSFSCLLAVVLYP